MAGPVQEQKDPVPLPSWNPATVTVMVMPFVQAFQLQNTSTKQRKLLVNEKRYRVFDSSFLLLRCLTQHGLHNPDLGALAAVNIGREIEEFSILSRASSVKQILHHNQSATVVLDHPCQEQMVKLFALCFS
jgi:microcompartment protein CcmK/EutM